MCQGIREDCHKSMEGYSLLSGYLVFRTEGLVALWTIFRLCISAPEQPWWSYLNKIAPVPCLSTDFKNAEESAYLMRCFCSLILRVGQLGVKNWKHSVLRGREGLGRYTEGDLTSEGFSSFCRVRRCLSLHKGCICIRNNYWLYCTFFFCSKSL